MMDRQGEGRRKLFINGLICRDFTASPVALRTVAIRSIRETLTGCPCRHG